MIRRLFTILLAISLVSCGYRLGGLKKTALQGVDTFCITMFANNTLYPNVAMQVTTALADQLQRDGTYHLASPEKSDVEVRGVVTSVTSKSLRTNSSDTYVSSEIGLTVHVTYQIVERSTGKVLVNGTTRAEGSYFNNIGNVQTAWDNALSYASRRVAELIVQNLSIP